MQLIQLLDAALAVLIPLVVAALAKSSYPAAAKGAMMLAFSLLVGAATVAAQGNFDATEIGKSFFLIAGVAQLSYLTLTKELAAKIQANFGNKDTNLRVTTEPYLIPYEDKIPPAL